VRRPGNVAVACVVHLARETHTGPARLRYVARETHAVAAHAVPAPACVDAFVNSRLASLLETGKPTVDELVDGDYDRLGECEAPRLDRREQGREH
jgi:hypothetical protein